MLIDRQVLVRTFAIIQVRNAAFALATLLLGLRLPAADNSASAEAMPRTSVLLAAWSGKIDQSFVRVNLQVRSPGSGTPHAMEIWSSDANESDCQNGKLLLLPPHVREISGINQLFLLESAPEEVIAGHSLRVLAGIRADGKLLLYLSGYRVFSEPVLLAPMPPMTEAASPK